MEELKPNYFDHIVSDMGIFRVVNAGAPSNDLFDDPLEHVIDEIQFLQNLGL